MTNEGEFIGDKGNVLLEVTFNFALRIIEFIEKLEESKKYIIAKQLLRSGTSIGSNAREAQFAESKTDFIHKLKISEKEADETEYWLLLCKHSEHYPFDENLLNELVSIKRILAKIITTSKQNLNK
jgi:four helix bundle protein